MNYYFIIVVFVLMIMYYLNYKSFITPIKEIKRLDLMQKGYFFVIRKNLILIIIRPNIHFYFINNSRLKI